MSLLPIIFLPPFCSLIYVLIAHIPLQHVGKHPARYFFAFPENPAWRLGDAVMRVVESWISRSLGEAALKFRGRWPTTSLVVSVDDGREDGGIFD
jgi:hypothetical protein